MEPGAMEWWYWFGMWIFGITSVVLTWWLFLDAARRQGIAARFAWPILSALGLIAQLPALAYIGEPDASAAGTAALLGIAGFMMSIIGAVTYFSKGASRSGGSGWTMTTRNESVDPTRIRGGGARAAVPVGMPVGSYLPKGSSSEERTKPGATGAPAYRIPGNRKNARRNSQDRPPAARLVSNAPAAAGGTPAPNADATLLESLGHDCGDPTISDTLFATSGTAAATALEDGTLIETIGNTHGLTMLDDGTLSMNTGDSVDNATYLEEGADTESATVLEDLTVVENSTILEEGTVADDGTVIEEDTVVDNATYLEEGADTESATVLEDDEFANDGRLTILEDDAASPPPAMLDSDENRHATAPLIMLTDGSAKRVVITERRGSFIVGRDPSKSNLAVDDPRASRAHFSITFTDESYYLSDLGSSNGTFINGVIALGPVRLAPGDTIEFGRTTAKFQTP